MDGRRSAGERSTLKRTDFSSRGDYLGQIRRSGDETGVSGSHRTQKGHDTRALAAISRLSVNITDCMAERGGFEPPRPFKIQEEEEFQPGLMFASGEKAWRCLNGQDTTTT
jgi:hypothetical protein